MIKKKGDSLIISYVLLIVIVLAIASLVYAFLKLYLPAKTPECPQDISIKIAEATCSIGTIGNPNKLNITITNTGLFNISAIFVRMAPSDKEVKPQVNPGHEILPSGPLPPKPIFLRLSYGFVSPLSSGDYVVEVQPAIIENKILVVCNAITSENVKCV